MPAWLGFVLGAGVFGETGAICAAKVGSLGTTGLAAVELGHALFAAAVLGEVPAGVEAESLFAFAVTVLGLAAAGLVALADAAGVAAVVVVAAEVVAVAGAAAVAAVVGAAVGLAAVAGAASVVAVVIA